MDIRAYNRTAWDRQVEGGNMWTVPVAPEVIAAARRGEVANLLTPLKPVPLGWYGELPGKDVLCLASGGGQQGPVLAAAGGRVTVFDNSPRQLEQDRLVAQRENLDLTTVEGDMVDLSVFPDESFDLIFHPVSNIFSSQVRPMWRECFRVLRPGGALLAGIVNPVVYIFDYEIMERENRLEVRHRLPYSDLEGLSPEQLARFKSEGTPLEFSHTLEDQIGGQLQAGFVLVDLYEDWELGDEALNRYMPKYFATRALKPAR
jgi:SAM-dependent methyltransferase